MSRLKVMLRGALVSEIELIPEKEYIGGRKDGSDIRLQAEKGISREHFKLKFSEGLWQISAVSRFGDVFSLGQKIQQADMQHGQAFQIPPYEFIFLDVPDAGLPNQDNAAINFGENEKTVLGAVPQVPYIKMVSSSGEVREMLRLEFGEVWVAGRDPSCQIIIPDQRVSRRQFEIYKVNGAYTVLDLASVNGTFLNGSPISSTDPQTLKSGDAISVLDNTMYFELHDPNFKYKVGRIEIPPLQVEQAEEEEAEEEEVYEEVRGDTEIIQNTEDVPQVEQYDVQQQLVTSDSPFTGMPGENGQDPNQFYNFQAPPQQQAPIVAKKSLMQNKPMLAIIVLVLLGGAYFISEILSPQEPTIISKGNESDPFSKLSPAQQKEVQEYYSLAEQMYNLQKYDLALEKIRKIKEILPSGYKDSAKIELDAEQAGLTALQRLKDEEALKEKEEREIKNKKIISVCEKLINPKVKTADMSECLAPVVAFDPANNDVVRLMAESEKIEKNRLQKESEIKIYEEQVHELIKLFAEAEAIQVQGYAFKAIKRYKIVVQTDLPDPKKLKEKAKDRIAFIEQKIRDKSEGSISTADNLFKVGNIKDAVITLREAKVYDPNNKSIQEKIDSYALELKRQVRTIYQESIIDENYGLIENTETKQGAKDKWKKITEIDLEDGEYFRKAVTKLRRYGVM